MNKKKRIILILLSVVACAVIVSIVLVFSGAADKIRLNAAASGEVKDGLLPVEGIEHITDVPNGEIRYLINKKVFFESPYSMGNFMFENPSSCGYALVFVIYDGDGKQIYTSPKINPGQYLEKDKLSSVLSSGVYECSYSAQAYSDDEFVGEISGVITLSIG